MNIQIPEKFQDLFTPARFKIYYGSRGGAKTTIMCIVLLIKSLSETCKILCCREYQTNIKNSVHAVLVQEIHNLGLTNQFFITNTSITSITGSEFIFGGLHDNIDGIKSIPNIKYCFIDEGQSITQHSLDILIPSIRAENAEIWIAFNPEKDTDAVYQMFVLKEQPNSIVRKVGWEDNPWFPDVLRQDKDSCYELDKDRYDWIWGGNVLQLSDTLIYKNKFVVEQFETPKDSIFYCGLDFGATHPTAATRCFIDTNNNILYIDAEAGEPCTDNDELPKLVDKILPHKRWPLYCDSEDKKGWMKLKQLGYNAQPVKKGPNSVIDGIMFLRGFSKIVVHPRCVQTINEFKRYSWKVDPYTQQTLPVPIKNYDHFLDSIRYALETVALNTHLSHKQWMKFIGTNNK